eukprot:1418584-Rhodomonas_salina.5
MGVVCLICHEIAVTRLTQDPKQGRSGEDFSSYLETAGHFLEGGMLELILEVFRVADSQKLQRRCMWILYWLLAQFEAEDTLEEVLRLRRLLDVDLIVGSGFVERVNSLMQAVRAENNTPLHGACSLAIECLVKHDLRTYPLRTVEVTCGKR